MCPGGLVKNTLLCPTGVFDSAGLEWDLRIYISHNFQMMMMLQLGTLLWETSALQSSLNYIEQYFAFFYTTGILTYCMNKTLLISEEKGSSTAEVTGCCIKIFFNDIDFLHIERKIVNKSFFKAAINLGITSDYFTEWSYWPEIKLIVKCKYLLSLYSIFIKKEFIFLIK